MPTASNCAGRSYAILDYKTGAARTEKQVRTGLAPQLTLEAAILRGGGFKDIPAGPVSEITYVTLKGGDPAGKPSEINFKDGTPDTQADHALARLKELAAKFEDEGTPYLSLVHPMWTTHYGDYDHLARVKEWSATGGGEDEVVTARTIPPAVRRVQVEAADPDVSAFVSANAGSGKTYVLAQRVINLLLRGVDPAKILCITFTKTAAANMANEVFKRLAGWTALDDAALGKQIELSTGRKPDARSRARARRLFASALETPGGLKVQTIHAFCTRLLHQFPFEANVAARFTVLDEASTTQLLDRLTLEVLLEASAKPDSALGKALETAIVVAADQTFKEVIADAIRERDAIEAWIVSTGSLDAALASCRRCSASARTKPVKHSSRNSFPIR